VPKVCQLIGTGEYPQLKEIFRWHAWERNHGTIEKEEKGDGTELAEGFKWIQELRRSAEQQ
jgi:hypothetical protein